MPTHAPGLNPAPAHRSVRRRHLRLEEPDPEDWRYVERMMDRECCRLGARSVQRTPDGRALWLDFAGGGAAEAAAAAAGGKEE